jgi:hypothetical protein
MTQRVWRFGLICALAAAFPLRAGQVQVQACSFALDEALQRGEQEDDRRCRECGDCRRTEDLATHFSSIPDLLL